jgi:hypothetical protein
MRACPVQEARRQFEVLLRMGAETAGSPAAEQLARLVRQYLHVRYCTLVTAPTSFTNKPCLKVGRRSARCLVSVHSESVGDNSHFAGRPCMVYVQPVMLCRYQNTRNGDQTHT